MSLTDQRTALCCFLALLWTLPGKLQAADPGPSLALERTIPLTGVSGRIDHMAVDLRRERLFVALQRLRPGLIDRALMRLARDPAVIAAATLPK